MDTGFELTERQKGLIAENGNPKYLRHYTQFPYLLKILETKKLKLSDSEKFSDRADKAWAEAYKKRSGNPLYILCFTWETELIHHWNTYAKNTFGCCITFDGTTLIEAAKGQGVKTDFVRYQKNIPYIEIPKDFPPEEIPFTKAWAYRCEHEYRFTGGGPLQYMDIDNAWIKQITLSHLMDEDTFVFFKKSIEKIYSGQVSRSKLETDE
jgi:hypothetical protein